jgi:tetratricopeptide (TPR) repeat protein
LYTKQSRYEKAEPLYLRVLSIREKNQGKEHAGVAMTLGNLADLNFNQGRHDHAEPLYRRALSIWEKVLDEEDPTLQRVRASFEACLDAQNKSL